MKKQEILLISLMVIIFVIVLAPNRGDLSDKTVNSESKTNVVHNNIQEPEANENTQKLPGYDSYSVKEYKGCIAVFKKGSEKPLRTTEISVKTLPEADQKILKNGIVAENNEQLNSILEDYLS